MISIPLPSLCELLGKASDEDRKNLEKILTGKADKDLGELTSLGLVKETVELREGWFGTFSGTYKELLRDVADHVEVDWVALLKIQPYEALSEEDLEIAITAKVFNDIYSKLSDKDKAKLAKTLGDMANNPDFLPHLLAGGAMAWATLSGFGVYLMATTTVGAITGALGITLPFVIYTTISRTISLVLGPIGWGVLAAHLLYTFARPSWKKLSTGVIYIAYIRRKLKEEV